MTGNRKLDSFGGPQPAGRCATCGTEDFRRLLACRGDWDFARTDGNPAGTTELLEANHGR